MSVKEVAQLLIADLPDDVTWDEIQYRFYLKQVIDESEAQIAAGQGITQVQVEDILATRLTG